MKQNLSMELRLPSVFLSSTFFDLRQVRADLADFISKNLGYRFLASEFLSFPVDPTTDTVENCRRRVENDADALVLIIGGRYGSIPVGSTKSVTNIEYLAARGKHIPIYVFISRDVLSILSVWERNPGADFSSVVDTAQLFEFVREVRATDGLWTFPFDTAQEIIETLRIQFAYQMARGLRFAARTGADLATDGLTGDSLRIAIERPPGWAGRLLVRLIQQELDAYGDQRRNHASGIALGIGETLSEEAMGDWLDTLSAQARRIADGLKVIVNTLLTTAFNSSDITSLRHAARQVGAAYRDCFEWAARVRRAHVPERWRAAVRELSHLLDGSAHEIETFAPVLSRQIDLALGRPGDGPRLVEATFVLGLTNVEKYNAELAKM